MSVQNKRTPMVAGNWKMNGRLEMAASLAESVSQQVPEGVELVLCPPAVYLPCVQEKLSASQVELGAQNVSEQEDGAFTGEISAEMLADIGAGYVLVGHSERRSLYGESSDCVADKFCRVQQAGLVPVLCVGETLEQREAERTETVIEEQLQAVLDKAGIEAFGRAVVAYEPVWAIGTGKTATPEQAQQIHAWIRARMAAEDKDIANSLRILYGGSVKPDNARSLFAAEDIDGGLIGGASLQADTFLAICQAAIS